jgi:hypothetical protein
VCTVSEAQLTNAPFTLAGSADICCEVSAINSRGISPTANGCGAYMPVPATCPSAMSAPRLISRESGALVLTCDLGGSDGGAPITEYVYTYSNTADASGFTSTVRVSQATDFASFNARQARISGLTDG